MPGALSFSLVSPVEVHGMNVIELTRALIDIESITNNEERIGNFLFECLAPLAAKYDGHVERVEVEPRRFNLFAQWGERLDVTLSTHMDTVPPFFASGEDEENIWGRGACDTKGIIASMVVAVEALLESGQRSIGLLFVVGEERNSAGAARAAPATSSTASPPETGWHWVRKARCVTKWRQAERWRTRPIRNWAIPPFT